MDAQELHDTSIVFDAHCDFLHAVVNQGRVFEVRSQDGHLDLPRLQQAGVTAQIFAIFALYEDEHTRTDPVRESLRQADAFFTMAERNRGRFLNALSAADVERAAQEGQVAGILSLEGVEPVAGDLRLLRLFYRLGVRNVGLTWNHRNAAADGVGVSHAGGLTEFGRQVILACNDLGMMIDIAHLAPAGVEEVFDLAAGPIIDSHANAYSLCPNRRNLTDAQLDRLAASGGVVCVTFVPPFVTSRPEEADRERVLDHIDYIVGRIGADHVGLGSDFEGYDGVTPGLRDVTDLPALTGGLLARGYEPAEVRKILGLNLLRVLRQVAG